MNQALHLPAYPVTEGCIGGIAEFEHTQPWIYGLDNPYLHGVYAPTTLELSQTGLRVEGELPKDLLGTYFRNRVGHPLRNTSHAGQASSGECSCRLYGYSSNRLPPQLQEP